MPLCPQITLTPVTVTTTGMTVTSTDGIYSLDTTSPAFTSVKDNADGAWSAVLGKNTIFYATTAPAGTHTVGDTWFDTDNGYKIYKWDGTQWVATQFGSAAFGAGSVDLAALATGAVDATKLVDGAVVQSKVAAGAIGANQIAANAIVAGKIAADAIVSSNIQAGQVTASLIAAGAITADKIAAGAISADMITSGTMNAARISGGIISGVIIDTSGGIKTAGLLVGDQLSIAGVATVNGVLTAANGFQVSSGGLATFSSYIKYPGQPTTSTAANCYLSGTSGAEYFYRSTSSSGRYKQDVTDLGNVPELDPSALLELPVRAFRYKPEHLPADDDRADVMIPGFIAEEVDEHYPIAADWDGGQPESWNDRMMIPGMLALIQQQNARIIALETRLTALEGSR